MIDIEEVTAAMESPFFPAEKKAEEKKVEEMKTDSQLLIAIFEKVTEIECMLEHNGGPMTPMTSSIMLEGE